MAEEGHGRERAHTIQSAAGTSGRRHGEEGGTRFVSADFVTERGVTLPLDAVPPGTSMAVKAFGTTVAIFNVEGELFAVGNNCPHHGGPLCHGHVSGANLPSQPYEYRYSREKGGCSPAPGTAGNSTSRADEPCSTPRCGPKCTKFTSKVAKPC